ncbi:hypothetical protein [Empedobacter brevis]|uniref:hypothetical protein n=1 Tax=Empedobacter brevis TaxID=247 RepID=UPI001FD58C07|nr:hypothetical protein [Empedobacter brevis]
MGYGYFSYLQQNKRFTAGCSSLQRIYKKQSLIALKYREPLPDTISIFTAQPKAESHFRCLSAGTAYGECCVGLYLYPFSELCLLHFRILTVQYCLLVFVSTVAAFTAKAGGQYKALRAEIYFYGMHYQHAFGSISCINLGFIRYVLRTYISIRTNL